MLTDKARAERKDLEYFRRNPSRYHRLRPSVRGEFDDITQITALVVRAPGALLGTVAVGLQVATSELPDNELFLELLWNALRARTASERTITGQELQTFAKMAGIATLP